MQVKVLQAPEIKRLDNGVLFHAFFFDDLHQQLDKFCRFGMIKIICRRQAFGLDIKERIGPAAGEHVSFYAVEQFT